MHVILGVGLDDEEARLHQGSAMSNHGFVRTHKGRPGVEIDRVVSFGGNKRGYIDGSAGEAVSGALVALSLVASGIAVCI